MADNSSISNSKSWRRLACKLTAMALLVALADFGAGALLSHFHGRTVEGDFGGRINAALNQQADILVLGSSRAKHHYIPSIIEQESGLSAFNAGFDAQTLLCHYGMEQLSLDAHVPKVILLEIGAEDLKAVNLRGAYDKLSVLLPYYWRGNAEFRALLLGRSPYESIKLWSRTYPFNSQLLPILKYTLSPESEGGSRTGGYVPYHGSELEKIVAIKKSKAKKNASAPIQEEAPAPELLAILEKFVQSARARGVRTVVVHSPLWMEPGLEDPAQQQMLRRLEEETRRLGASFLDVSLERYPELRNPAFFKDTIHLNDTGARVFSAIVGRETRQWMNPTGTAQ